jgi:MoeA C-terminal region (domain IV)
MSNCPASAAGSTWNTPSQASNFRAAHRSAITTSCVPLLRRLAGRNDLTLPRESAVLGCTLAANDERADYMRATLECRADGTKIATPFPAQDSSLLVPLRPRPLPPGARTLRPRGQAGSSGSKARTHDLRQ